MKTQKLMIMALVLGLSATSVFAQNDGPPSGPPSDGQNDGPPGGPGGGRRHRPMMPLIAALDTNHDGVLSADEIANAPAALKTLDTNNDGQLTKDEYLPPHPRGGPGGGPGGQGQDGPPPSDDNGKQSDQAHPQRPVPPIVAALDTNHDGVISADEIAAAATSLKTLDKNGDGELTMDELMGPRPKRDGKGPGNGQRPPPPAQDNQ